MDNITKELDNLIICYDFEGKTTDIACCNKIKMDYLLMLTIAATWDLKSPSMDEEKINNFFSCLQRPEIGKLIRLIDDIIGLDKSITSIFDLYKNKRNLEFGHTTFDEYQALRLNEECKLCWDSLMQLPEISDLSSNLIRKLYQENNDFFYIVSIKQNEDMLVKLVGNKNEFVQFPKINMKARMVNKENDIQAGDLFLCVDDKFIKISPFIQLSDKEKMFMMLLDIETSPELSFKMAYIYRTTYASESAKYLDEFPYELRKYFPKEIRKIGKNGVSLNHFSQYELFEQEYYKDVHQEIQAQLDKFICGNMPYGSVRGVGGVGKTSVVFMWINRILNNEDNILDSIRKHFNLRRIIFLSAKKRIYSRDVNTKNLSNFYDIKSDVSNYNDVIQAIYSIFHQKEKAKITFEDKVDYIKNYNNQSHCILIIIDDYESLSKQSREKIQLLKDHLKPDVIKILITTRFSSKESKDIIVQRLKEDDCAKMTDHIFKSTKWRFDLKSSEMHSLTGGLPLLIWYAKAYFQTGRLSCESLKSSFSGPAEGLEYYLYDNFLECFEDIFTKNFLMLATRYYELHNILQISKKTAVFLCLKDAKKYKVEDEEFYFQELIDLKLININQSSSSIDFSALRTYMDRTPKKQEPKEEYQKDALNVLIHLDEEKNNSLHAVIESSKYLEDKAKCRVLSRMIDFAQDDEDIKILAIKKIFDISFEKIKLYKENTNIFQNSQTLIKSMITYLLNETYVIKENYELIRDFVKSISVFVENKDDTNQISYKAVELVNQLLALSSEERYLENITNFELEVRAKLLRNLAIVFTSKIEDIKEKQKYIKSINENLEDISTFCEKIETI